MLDSIILRHYNISYKEVFASFVCEIINVFKMKYLENEISTNQQFEIITREKIIRKDKFIKFIHNIFIFKKKVKKKRKKIISIKSFSCEKLSGLIFLKEDFNVDVHTYTGNRKFNSKILYYERTENK